MGMLTEAQSRDLLDRVLKLSQADTCTAGVGGSHGGNIRYARNTVSTAGEETDQRLNVTATFGKRSGSSSTNDFSADAIANCVRRAEALAKLSPENPEAMPLLGPQSYRPTPAWSDRTDGVTAADRARIAAASIQPAKAAKCVAAGFENDSARWTANANSAGQFGYHRSTGAAFSVTMRTEDETGSGYATTDANDFGALGAERASELAIQKAVASRNARALEPGKYTVILEPPASDELLGFLWGQFNARNADEGRSFLAKQGGGNRLGEKLFDDTVTVRSDPWDARIPGTPWGGDGAPAQATTWIDKGVVKSLACNRYWAEKTGRQPLNGPGNIIMEGGSGSVDDLIKGTERGILVTRFWYIRSVDQQTVLATGLTRDGTFYIENGQIKHAVKNFRFNESPVIMLNNVDALAAPVRINGSLLPPMRIRDFTFTSLSDAV
ncbi:MAG: TldD/PmbA family protein [Gemmatimonadales bacterium]